LDKIALSGSGKRKEIHLIIEKLSDDVILSILLVGKQKIEVPN